MGTAGSTATGSGGTASLAGSTGTGTAGSTGTATASATGTGTAGSIGAAGATGMGGVGGGAGGTASANGLRQGPFKIIVLTTTDEYRHASIPTCLQMLMDLGSATAPERATIPGLVADSTWTVDHIGDGQVLNGVKAPDEFQTKVTADNLKNYEVFYSDNPSGKVFTNQPNGTGPAKKQVFVDFWNNGGSWAGQHSATDFENSGSWTWSQDNINGGWLVQRDYDGTPGTISWQSAYVDHPILKGLTSPWNTTDEQAGARRRAARRPRRVAAFDHRTQRTSFGSVMTKL
jgi:hypothetical protein